jgi:hypothetical protein
LHDVVHDVGAAHDAIREGAKSTIVVAQDDGERVWIAAPGGLDDRFLDLSGPGRRRSLLPVAVDAASRTAVTPWSRATAGESHPGLDIRAVLGAADQRLSLYL